MDSGSLSPKVFASYDPNSSSWRTSTPSAAGGSTAYSATWPRSGMTQGGRAYELPTLARHTAESVSSSSRTTQREKASSTLLPTPNTGDMKSAQLAEMRKARRHQARLGDVLVIAPPRKNEVVANTACTGRIRGETQTNEKGASTQRPGGVAELYSSYDWGEYEPAVRRWEAVVGRVAPSPIEKGTKGQPRLAARFVEWLMGLPVGYVTGIGLPRSGELKALGNGVVPQQAEEALRALLQSAIDDEPISA